MELDNFPLKGSGLEELQAFQFETGAYYSARSDLVTLRFSGLDPSTSLWWQDWRLQELISPF